jgi:hypothetical protein
MFTPFKKNEVLHSVIKAYPEIKFFIYDKKVYYNNKCPISGAHVSNVGHMDTGYLSLYEENIDRPTGQLIYPFITKDGSLTSFKTVSTTNFNSDFAYGDIMSSSYPLIATISRDRFASGQARPHVVSLQNILNYYRAISPHYAYDSDFGDKSTQELGLISIPSIFYGSSIKKGSIDLKFYISGSLFGRLQDIKRNGELIQTEPVGSNGSGSCAGVALYNEGFMILTGAWDITTVHVEPYIPGDPAQAPRWIDFASTGSTGASENLPSSSFDIYFQGTQYVNTLTMICNASKGEFNHSNNPTFLDYGQNFIPQTGSFAYVEPDTMSIKNIVKTNWNDPTGSFEKITYIEKVLLWDEHKNLIGVAKLAKPLRKREKDAYSIKLKLDF